MSACIALLAQLKKKNVPLWILDLLLLWLGHPVSAVINVRRSVIEPYRSAITVGRPLCPAAFWTTTSRVAPIQLRMYLPS